MGSPIGWLAESLKKAAVTSLKMATLPVYIPAKVAKTIYGAALSDGSVIDKVTDVSKVLVDPLGLYDKIYGAGAYVTDIAKQVAQELPQIEKRVKATYDEVLSATGDEDEAENAAAAEAEEGANDIPNKDVGGYIDICALFGIGCPEVKDEPDDEQSQSNGDWMGWLADKFRTNEQPVSTEPSENGGKKPMETWKLVTIIVIPVVAVIAVIWYVVKKKKE